MANDNINLNKTIFIIIGIAIIAFIVLILAIVFNSIPTSSVPSSAVLGSSSQSIITNTSATLSPTEEGITSSSGTANNDSWMEFDGVNDNVIVPSDESLNITQNITISIWVNSATNEQNTDSYFIRANNDAYGISSSDNIRAGLWIQNSSGTFLSSGVLDDNLTTNQWHHLVGRYNGTDLSLFLNGIENKTSSYIGDIRSLNLTVIVGAESSSGSRFFTGGIDEVRIYNTSLTDAQISQIFNSGRLANSSLPSDGLVLWYSFNSGSGTIVRDKSGLGNDGV